MHFFIMPEFKVKGTSHDFKTVDSRSLLKGSIVHSTYKTKESVEKGINKDDKTVNEYASGIITNTEKEAASTSSRAVKNYSVKKFKERRTRKRNIKNEQQVFDRSVNESSRAIDKSTKDTKNVANNVKNVKRFKTTRTKKAEQSMKQMLNAQKQAFKQKQMMKKAKNSAKRSSYAAKETIKTTYIVIKQVVKALSSIPFIGWAIGGMITLVVLMFFMTSMTYLNNSTVITEMDNQLVSEEVLQYNIITKKYADQYGIGEYVDLIQAVMMQESQGKGTDVMKVSESDYNTKYPHEPDSIKEAEYSIDCGVHKLADCIKQAKVSSPTDMKPIYLALQGYNYGSEYIDWAVKNFGGYSEANAETYSDNKKKELKVKKFGDKQYVAHVMRYYNRGNGDIVKVAQQEIGNKGGQKFWSWYGFKSRVEWCACFVSWCGDKSNLIATNKMPKFASCQEQGIPWFKKESQWAKKGAYPMKGYIIFFDWQGDGVSDHVGIVEYVEGDVIHTIEGNSNDVCKRNTYRVSDSVIYGYGIIK